MTAVSVMGAENDRKGTQRMMGIFLYHSLCYHHSCWYLFIIFHSLSSLFVKLPFNLFLSYLITFSSVWFLSHSYSTIHTLFNMFLFFFWFSSPLSLHCSLITHSHSSLFSLERYILFIYHRITSPPCPQQCSVCCTERRAEEHHVSKSVTQRRWAAS